LIRYCRDCANFEDRRDIDGVVLCKRNHAAQVCCEEFTNYSLNKDRLYNMFCTECENFQEINGTPICANNNIAGVACEDFIDKFIVVKKIAQNNKMKTVLIVHALNKQSKHEPFPDFLVKVGRKIMQPVTIKK